MVPSSGHGSGTESGAVKVRVRSHFCSNGILITALQETLGLKVESRKDNIDILVVDHAERTPTAN
jgi:uncharacterized protein (TIGR03435 family)